MGIPGSIVSDETDIPDFRTIDPVLVPRAEFDRLRADKALLDWLESGTDLAMCALESLIQSEPGKLREYINHAIAVERSKR